ncbi:MAG: DNA-directed RNA polymerase subunit beta [Dehalococcoidia bacterium]|nr:DNA-directed RNA polymerase subunit beta [Dehalococcoidia bacterium]
MATLASTPFARPHEERRSFGRLPHVLEPSSLIQLQIHSFEWLKREGIRELLEEVNPIQDMTGTHFELHFGEHEFRAPKATEQECREQEATFDAALYVTVKLVIRETGEIKEQTLYFGELPQMTPTGTFVINGAERVVVSQLVRSPGAYFTRVVDPGTGRGVALSKIIPYRGAWLEFETSPKDIISVKVDRKRKAPVTTFLRALGYESDTELLALFEDVDTNPEHPYIRTTLEKDPVKTSQQALIEIYRRLRPGEPPNVETARTLLDNLFFNPRRYDLGRVGRYKMNRRLSGEASNDARTLTRDDLIAMIRTIIRINNGEERADDIDHLGNRRVRAVGELIQNQLRVGLLRMERVVKERMSILDQEQATPSALVNIRPVVASVREFFGGSQLSQFMDQTNPLAELTHKRRLSALGPGGLSRERAGFDVRDVHYSHYGRICPIETPEGPNIGLLGSLATYARINEYGFIETPYRRIHHAISSADPDLVGRTVLEEVQDGDGKRITAAGHAVSALAAKRIAALPERELRVRSYVKAGAGDDIIYLPADEEDKYIVAQANSILDRKNQFAEERVECRVSQTYSMEPPDRLHFIDVSPMQTVSVSTALIPFLEHDDANRALMGSNMQRQAVPLLRPEAPLVGTGMERRVARDSGQMVLSSVDGAVISVTGNNVTILDNDGREHRHPLRKFVRSNQGTCLTQRPIVAHGDRVAAGDPLADSSSTDHGDLALGQNVLVAFMAMDGYNFEDAIIVSESLVRDAKFTSIHIEKYEVESRDTKLGPGEITRDIPNVGEDALRDLDEEGVIRIGAEVGPGDILVGKITPKGETELTAEEKLLRAIFGEKARDVKDTSLRVPHGERGKVTDVRVLTRENGDDLPAGVNKLVRVWIAQTRTLSEGDKMAGRHGNKGVVSRIMPVEDMPYLPDGTPVDIILNPIGVPSRMNLGQVLETHLGLAAHKLNYRAVTPVFDGADDTAIQSALARAWLVDRAGAGPNGNGPEPDWSAARAWIEERGFDAAKALGEGHPQVAIDACLKVWLEDSAKRRGEEPNPAAAEASGHELYTLALEASKHTNDAPPIIGKSTLYDGRSGEPFDNPVTVGYIYMLKLIHLVEDKIHARSTGPYSLITQQPLGGKAQFGGQRFGEMEVWALEAYSAAYNLQEMLTVKSDDVVGRVKTYEAIVKGEDIVQPGIPESFNVLVKELQSLGLAVELRYEEDHALALPSRLTYAEEEEDDGTPKEPVAAPVVAPLWEAALESMEEEEQTPAVPDVRTELKQTFGRPATLEGEDDQDQE